MKQKNPDRSTLHTVNELTNPHHHQKDQFLSLSSWHEAQAQRIHPVDRKEQERLLTEQRNALEKKQNQIKWGMTIFAACAALLWAGKTFAQDAARAPVSSASNAVTSEFATHAPSAKTAISSIAKKPKGAAPVAAHAQIVTTSKGKAGPVEGPAETMVAAAKDGKYPAPIKTMVTRGKGVRVLDVFEASGGLVGFVVVAANAEQRIYYVTQDGSTAIYGLAFDAQLNNLTSKHLGAFTNPLSPTAGVGTIAPMPASVASAVPSAASGAVRETPSKDDLWSLPTVMKPAAASGQVDQVDLGLPYSMALKARGAFVEGKGLPVYIVFDLACPYCHKTYLETRDLLGQLEIHWIPVGALGPRSILLGETFIRSKDKAQAMASAVKKELIPAEFSTSEVNQVLNENSAILTAANVANVPLILFLDHGKARRFLGTPSPAQLQELSRVATQGR